MVIQLKRVRISFSYEVVYLTYFSNLKGVNRMDTGRVEFISHITVKSKSKAEGIWKF